jgi:hypothetical protein
MDKWIPLFLDFDWDQGNLDKNWLKHHVNHWECEQVFFNEPLIILDDFKHSILEKRWVALGMTDRGRLLVIIFTQRNHHIRVISARDMNKKERAFYGEN